jgi:uridylate kinase
MSLKRVIKVGGSLLFEGDILNSAKIKEFCEIIKPRDDILAVVCGGGIVARKYIQLLRELGVNESKCDMMSIYISRLNAKLIIEGLRDASYPIVPETIEELSKNILFNKIVVLGGLQPGQSTTSVALEVSEFLNADELLILTDVDGIFNKDPKKFSDATKFDELTKTELQDLILKSFSDKQAAAGEYRIFDVVSLQILKRSELKVRIFSGKKLELLKKILDGNSTSIGTLIKSS